MKEMKESAAGVDEVSISMLTSGGERYREESVCYCEKAVGTGGCR